MKLSSVHMTDSVVDHWQKLRPHCYRIFSPLSENGFVRTAPYFAGNSRAREDGRVTRVG